MLRIVCHLVLGCALMTGVGCCVQRVGGGPGLGELCGCDTCEAGPGPCASGGCGDGSCASGSCGVLRGGIAQNVLRDIRALTCGSGCGEFYFDEWLSDPPDCCDPCDNCGNWIGPQGLCECPSRTLHRGNLWGQRFDESGYVVDGSYYDGEVLLDDGWQETIDPGTQDSYAPEMGESVLFTPTSHQPQRTTPRTTLRQARGE